MVYNSKMNMWIPILVFSIIISGIVFGYMHLTSIRYSEFELEALKSSRGYVNENRSESGVRKDKYLEPISRNLSPGKEVGTNPHFKNTGDMPAMIYTDKKGRYYIQGIVEISEYDQDKHLWKSTIIDKMGQYVSISSRGKQ